MEETAHWTSQSLEAFIRRITFDFIAQLEKTLEALPMSQADLAQKLKVSEGAVSQVLNNPGNLTLKTIVKYARALGLKIAIVAYDDGDHDNKNGPINSEVFSLCWERAKKPTDFFSLRASDKLQEQALSGEYMTVMTPGGKGAYIFSKDASTFNPRLIPPAELEKISRALNTDQYADNRGVIKRKSETLIEVVQ